MPDPSTLTEWLDENQHRAFPLDDSMPGTDVTGLFTLPTSFMVDTLLCAPPDVDAAMFYVKSLVVRRYSIDVEIGYDGDGEELTVGRFTKIPHDQAINSVYQFEPAPQTRAAVRKFAVMTGVLIVGSVTELLARPGQWSFQSSSTAILASRVVPGAAAVVSLAVGESIYSGNVALREGAGIILTPSWDAGRQETVITVSADLGSLAALEVPLTSDAAILENLTKIYGQPITNINTVKPDVDGNFTLQPLDCTVVAPVGGGLSISNPCSLPCCDKNYLDDVYTSLSELNLRYARMEGYYQSLGRNINDLQSRMIALEI